jgi:small GTP-binding protein
VKRITVGILAHVDSGKTTLSEAMLYISGSIKKLGRVDRGDSFLDNYALERSRGITIFSKQAVMQLGDTEFTVLDTPGHVDFSAETERTLQVLDYAILVISATDGVQSHTRTLWELLQKYGVPCFVFVNKMDLDGADKNAVLSQLKAKLNPSCVDFGCGSKKELDENIAVCDDVLLTKYYECEKIEKADIIRAVKERKLFPCICGSALKLDGVESFMELLCEYTEMPDYPAEFAGKVYKISEDSQGSRLTFLKVTGGTLKVKEVLGSSKNTSAEKVNQIRIYSGDKFRTADSVEAGTVCAVTGITFAAPGDGLGTESNSRMPVLEPVLAYRVEASDGTDVHTLLAKMKILEAEEPQLRVVYNERLGEIQVRLMGDIQLEILKSLISERFGIEVEFGKGNIIYKETIGNTVEGVGHFEPLRHYAEVHLLLKPGKRDSGLVFRSECKEDLLDKNWQRLILTHLYEKAHTGVLTGSPITDMEIILASGKAHPKHTEGGDFRQATYRAVRQGLRNADNILLEPVYDFSLEIPQENVGRAMSDIQLMHGSFNTPEQLGENVLLTGTAPVSEMNGYTSEVMQYTHGTGRLVCTFRGYDVCHNTAEIIEQFGYSPDADTDNPSSSVFCSHGAGYTVKWDEVTSHMHLPSVLSRKKNVQTEPEAKKQISSYKNKKSIFALDKELMQIFERTYGEIKPRSFSAPTYQPQQKNPQNEKYRRPKTPEYDGEEYLLVDGYNVIYSWDRLHAVADESIEAARNMLINILCNYQGYKKCELILVFDAYKVRGSQREVEKINNISIVYTKEAETADMYIEKTSHKLAKKHKVRVVTSDGLEQLIILSGGALRVSSREFLYEVTQAEEEIERIIDGIK